VVFFFSQTAVERARKDVAACRRSFCFGRWRSHLSTATPATTTRKAATLRRSTK